MTAPQPNRNEEWSEISPTKKGGGGGNLLLQRTKGVNPPHINTRRVAVTTTNTSKNGDLSQTLRRHNASSGHKLIPPMNHIPRNDSSLSASSSSSRSSRLSCNDIVVSSSKPKNMSLARKLRHGMESSPAKLSCQSSNQRCSDSYQMFQRCSTGSSDLSTISCGAAVASYMKCAFDQC